MVHFADRFIESAQRLGTPLCVGLDPHLEQIPSEFLVRPSEPFSEYSARGTLEFLEQVIDECAGRVPAVKPQIAFFEQLGWRGIQILEQLVQRAQRRGLLVLLDAKRGDIGSTAAAYARAYLSPNSPCQVDAITVSPYLGVDTLAPFLAAATEYGSGLFVLSKTSNPGARDFQDLVVDGEALFKRVARTLRPFADALVGTSGWSSLGIVAGATFPEEAAQLREVLPRSLFLIPGIGAQGAPIESALASFVKGTTGPLGGLISSSRGILFEDSKSSSGEDWRTGLRRRLFGAIGTLRTAMTSIDLLT